MSEKAKQAIHICIEGSDGAGKKTQTKILVDRLIAKGYKVATVSFPRYRDTWAGKALHELLKSERAEGYNFLNSSSEASSMLYAADRFESIPWLTKLSLNNDFVVYDRAVASNLIHQGGKFKTDEDRDIFGNFIENLEYKNGFPRPDITFFLSLPFEISMKRAVARAKELGESADLVELDHDYMKNSYESGMFYAQKYNWTIVEGFTNRELSVEEIHQNLWSEVEKFLQ